MRPRADVLHAPCSCQENHIPEPGLPWHDPTNRREPSHDVCREFLASAYNDRLAARALGTTFADQWPRSGADPASGGDDGERGERVRGDAVGTAARGGDRGSEVAGDS